MKEPDDISTGAAARAEGLAREIAAIVDAKFGGLSAADLDKVLAQKSDGSPMSGFNLELLNTPGLGSADAETLGQRGASTNVPVEVLGKERKDHE